MFAGVELKIVHYRENTRCVYAEIFGPTNEYIAYIRIIHMPLWTLRYEIQKRGMVTYMNKKGSGRLKNCVSLNSLKIQTTRNKIGLKYNSEGLCSEENPSETHLKPKHRQPRLPITYHWIDLFHNNFSPSG